MIAGRNLLVERSVVFRDVTVNDAGFAESPSDRAEGRQHHVSRYRQGLRYFVKSGETRVVSDRPTTKAKAVAMGVTIDPSFAFPLPIFGINYLDFAFHGPDNQLAMLFARRAGGHQHPAAEAAAHAVRRVARLLRHRGAVERSRVRLGRRASGRARDHLAAHDRHQSGMAVHRVSEGDVPVSVPLRRLSRGHDHDRRRFVVPSCTITNGLGGAYEYRRGGYSLVLNGAWYARSSWEPWGLSDPTQPNDGLADPQRTYVRYSGNLSRDFFLGPFRRCI